MTGQTGHEGSPRTVAGREKSAGSVVEQAYVFRRHGDGVLRHLAGIAQPHGVAAVDLEVVAGQGTEVALEGDAARAGG
ncbi:hypothetical protein LHK_00335 [Laribacter hongkongensis HLHK9]|uniref:Uncharacterized protein n=1 Tax=Laribacter hongkongensis (strain HLHK9) TaxID=557598 RepID=C1DBD3_LARHH|nr:hypothetical protein LHK_00335 [Laribacter hongkongensis HLHK9]